MPPRKKSVKQGAGTPAPDRSAPALAAVPVPVPVTPAPPPQTAPLTTKTQRQIRFEQREQARKKSEVEAAKAQEAAAAAAAIVAAQAAPSTVGPTTTTDRGDSISAPMSISDGDEGEPDQGNSVSRPVEISDDNENVPYRGNSISAPVTISDDGDEPVENVQFSPTYNVYRGGSYTQPPVGVSQPPETRDNQPTVRRPSYRDLGSIGSSANGPVAQIAARSNGSSHRSSTPEVFRTPRSGMSGDSSSQPADITQTEAATRNSPPVNRVNQTGWSFPNNRPNHPTNIPPAQNFPRPTALNHLPTSSGNILQSSGYVQQSPSQVPQALGCTRLPSSHRPRALKNPGPGGPNDPAITGPPQQLPKRWWEYFCEEVSGGIDYISNKRWQLVVLVTVEAWLFSSVLCSAGPICDRHSRLEIAWKYLTDSYYVRLNFLAISVTTVLLMTEFVDWTIGIYKFVVRFGREGVWYVPWGVAGAKAQFWHNSRVFGYSLLDECVEPLLLAVTALNLSWNVGYSDGLSLFCSMAVLHFAKWVAQASERYFNEQHNRYNTRGPWKRWIWVSIVLALILLNIQIWLTIPVQVWEWCFGNGIHTKFPSSTVEDHPVFTDTIAPTVTGNIEAALTSLLVSTGLTLVTTTIVV